MRKHVIKHRRVYEANYRDIRHKIFAHKAVSDRVILAVGL
jgi:hypothetical protein